MENRIQFVFLKGLIFFIGFLSLAVHVIAESEKRGKGVNVNDEVFELGITAGVINIADFGSEFTSGLSTTFHASESFFLQFNFMSADVGLSAYEENQGRYIRDNDRDYLHYNLLLGYTLFQGEVFGSRSNASLSSLYLIGGVGDTEFGGETAFTYVYGVGYQMGLGRRFNLRFDNRNYIYRSSLIKEDEEVHNSQLSAGIGFVF